MGVSTEPVVATPRGRIAAWTNSPLTLRHLAAASVVVNVGIVVTGGAVRLTDSGLGCPTWPRCSGGRLVPNDALGVHGVIEFSNRLLTFVVGATLALTLFVAWRQRRQVGLAALALAGIPAQAILGGIVVRTDLNPWLVALHFLLSAAIIAVTFVLWWRTGERRSVAAPPSARLLGQGLVAVAALVLVAGTLVTGAGPHAGDVQHGQVRRIDLSIAGLAQLHADLVMALIGLTVGVLALAYALHAAPLQRAALVLLGVELAQGGIGYTQYFLHVPPLLVAVHMLGACLVWLATLRVLLTLAERPARTT
ncbi:MAG TPA: COX15/CtaA family protein [Jatrophihabitans sp.]|jgi:cytochrome c oxidase assembly protein subunit 15|nr:COX15/CtaA family protein [Jatrophihabitans sp.]